MIHAEVVPVRAAGFDQKDFCVNGLGLLRCGVANAKIGTVRTRGAVMGGHLKTVLGRLWVDELFVAHLEANYRDDAVECAEYSVYGNCGESQGTGTREKWRVCWGIARGSP